MTQPTPEWNMVPIFGRYVGTDGTPISGRVLFKPRASRLVDTVALTTLIGRQIAFPVTDGVLTGIGGGQAYLPATDDTDLTGTPFTFSVTEDFDGGGTYDIEVPLAALGNTPPGVQLALAASVLPNPGISASIITRLEILALVAAATTAGTWQPSTAYLAGAVVLGPDGSMIVRNADGNSRPAFDGTELAAWLPVVSKTGTLEHDAIVAMIGAATPAATRTVAGLVPLATPTEAVTGANDSKAVTPLGLHGALPVAADHSTAGIVPLATTLEATTGTVDTKAVTPVGLAAAVTALKTALLAGVDPAWDTFLEVRAGMLADESGAAAMSALLGTVRNLTDSTMVTALRTLVAADIIDPASLIGAEVAAGLAAKLTTPAGGGGGLGIIQDPVTGLPTWGLSAGTLAQQLDGTLVTNIFGSTGTLANVLEGGGFMNGVGGPNPAAWPVQTGAPMKLWGDVYGAYFSLNQASSWDGANDGVSDVKYNKGITEDASKTTPNVTYHYSSNYNGTNGGAVDSALWKHVYNPATKTVTPTMLCSLVGNAAAVVTAAQPNLYRAMGDGAGHPRQTGDMMVTSPTQDGVGWLVHADGLVQWSEAGGVTLKGFNGAATKNMGYCLRLDPVKDPTTGIDLYAAFASGSNAGVWHISNAQLPGVVGAGGGPTATLLTGGAAPSQPLDIAEYVYGGVTHLLVADAGLPGVPGGLRHWNGATWTDVTPTTAGVATPTPSSGLPGFPGGLAGQLGSPSNGGTSNTGVIVYKTVDVVMVGGSPRAIFGHCGPDALNKSKMGWTDNAHDPTSWHLHVDADNLANFPQKGSGRLSWLGNAPNGPATAGYPYFMMMYGSAGWDCSNVWIDRSDPTKAYASGRSGLWFINLTGSVNAQPANNGMGAAICLAAAFSPNNPLVAMVADSDWSGFLWRTGFGAPPQMLQHQTGAVTMPDNVDGRDVRLVIDNAGLTAGLLAQAQRSTFNGGEVRYGPDITANPGSWYPLFHGNNPTRDPAVGGIDAVQTWTDRGVRGLTVTKHTDGELVIIAYVGPQIVVGGGAAGDALHAGIWRIKGTWNSATQRLESGGAASVWIRADATFSAFTSQYQVVRGDHARTATDAGTFYSYDPRTAGLVRSLDYGVSWSPIFPRLDRAIYRYSGAVKADKAVPNRVWVTIPGSGSSAGEVWRIDNAHDGVLNSAGTRVGGGTITATRVNVGTTGAALDNPGQLVVKADGTVIVHQGVSGAGTAHHPGLFASKDGGATWADLGTPAFRAIGAFVYGMALSSDEQTILLATDGNGSWTFPLAPPSQAIPVYTLAQVNAIRDALQTQITALSLGPLLTDIKGLTPAASDFIQYLAGHYVTRTPAQVKTALAVDAVLNTPQISRSGFNVGATAVTPNATANVDGSAQTVSPTSGFVGIYCSSFSVVYTNVSAETLTTKITVTYDDASTKSSSPSTTSTTTTNSSSVQMQGFFKPGRYITGISIVTQSTKAASTATAAVTFLGANI